MAKPKVLLTRSWPAAVEAKMAEAFDLSRNRDDKPLGSTDMRAAMQQYDAVLPTVTDRLPALMFEGPTRAKILANYGVGFEAPQPPGCAARLHRRYRDDLAFDGRATGG